MKKIFFLTAAICAVMTISASVVNVNLSSPSTTLDRGKATTSFADGVLTVNWEVTDAWGAAGVEFALNNLSGVSAVSFEYQGDGAEIGLIPYLRDSEGNRWWDAESWSSLAVTEWTEVIITPGTCLWDGATYKYGDQPFVKVGFIANPATAVSGVFKLRNITITYGEGGGGTELPDPDSLVYNGVVLPHNTQFTRTQCGSVSESLKLDEVSGIACSRTTPGYLWMESDNFGDYIIATTEAGQQQAMKVNFPNLKTLGIRYWDWEDLCGGVYNDKNYLFIGAFGDNNEEDDFYSIVYFEEPAITGGEINVDPAQIHYVYPDGKSHNNEALMYDNVEQVLYIITKVYYNVCQVYSLPFRTDYGDATQTLKHVCDLGVKSDIALNPKNVQCLGFHLVTGADISADGKYVLIKNHNNISGYAEYSWVLYWERQGNESIAETVKRQPEVIDCYEYEWQGEAICWLDDNTFYTTSDSDGEPPIYKYTRNNLSIENAKENISSHNRLVCIDNIIYLRTDNGIYTLDGRKVK